MINSLSYNVLKSKIKKSVYRRQILELLDQRPGPEHTVPDERKVYLYKRENEK